MKESVTHEISPVFDESSRVLLLGTMPSPASREAGFFYSHPQNRFWPVLATVFGEEEPKEPEARRNFCLRHKIALWDVLKSCIISGADDASIEAARPNDLTPILNAAHIRAIFTTGSRAAALYRRLCLPVTCVPAIPLPSTSPANCRYYNFAGLVGEYKKIKDYIE